MKIPAFDPINYLLLRKFPNLNAFYPEDSFGTQKKVDPKTLKAIENYRASLISMSGEEIKNLCDQEKAKAEEEERSKKELEEKKRFFHQPDSAADFVYWAKATYWTLDEAIALSLGKDPKKVRWEPVKAYADVSAFAQEYSKRRELAIRATTWKKLYDPVLPSIFIDWAKKLDIEVPLDLVEQVELRVGSLIDWKERYDKLFEEFKKREDKFLEEYKQLGEKYATSIKEALTNKDGPVVKLGEQIKSLYNQIKELESQRWEGFDPESAIYPEELDTAMQAWRAITNNPLEQKTPKQQILDWLEKHASKNLSLEAKERIAIICNWEKKGGRKKEN